MPTRDTAKPRLRIAPVLITLATIAVAVALGWVMWDAYMGAPWTRDGTVRAYVVTMAPEVAGRIVELPVVDNQFVHKGDLLMAIDPTDYRIAVSLAEAAVQQAEANAQNAESRGKTPAAAERPGGQRGGPADLTRPTRSPPRPNISRPWPIWSRRGSTSSARRSARR